MRSAADQVIGLKHAMISGAWANSNFDDGKNGREELLRKIDEFAESAIAHIYNQDTQGEYVEEVDMESPFWAAMKVPKLEVTNQAIEELPSG